MELTHYAEDPITFDPTRTHKQHPPHSHGKPVGLWVSVDGEDDWKWWNENEREINPFTDHAHEASPYADYSPGRSWTASPRWPDRGPGRRGVSASQPLGWE